MWIVNKSVIIWGGGGVEKRQQWLQHLFVEGTAIV